MDAPRPHKTEVWAQLFLCEEDRVRVHDFFVSEFGVKPRHIVRKMHITVYHARRPMPGVLSISEPAKVVLAAAETRFMVMAPGGENPRPELDPARRKLGIRVHKQSAAIAAIMAFRERLLRHETWRVLGWRPPSTHRSNAFGARHYQPHMAVLWAGSGIARDLRQLGVPFREKLGDLRFDRFEVEVVTLIGDGAAESRHA
jgi:hypothetical protein